MRVVDSMFWDIIRLIAAMIFVILLFLLVGCTPGGFVRARPYANATKRYAPYAHKGIDADTTISFVRKDALHQQVDFTVDGLEEAAQREGK